MKQLFAVLLAGLTVCAGSARGDFENGGPGVAPTATIGTWSAGHYASIFNINTSNAVAATETYSVAPLVQTSSQAFFITNPGAVTHLYDQTTKVHGANLANSPGNIVVNELLTDLGGGNYRVQVQLTAVDANNAPTAWVGAGLAGQGFVAWRMDLGTTAGGTDKITPFVPWTVTASGQTWFNAAGASIGSGALTLNDSNAAGLSGLGVVGLGGADIAGFNFSGYQLFWEINTPIPEPASASLLAGLVAVAGFYRRRV